MTPVIMNPPSSVAHSSLDGHLDGYRIRSTEEKLPRRLGASASLGVAHLCGVHPIRGAHPAIGRGRFKI